MRLSYAHTVLVRMRKTKAKEDLGENSLLSAIAVYLPCFDLGVDCYREHMKELERVVSESRLLDPVTVLGDFNEVGSVSKTCKECCCRRCWKDVS